MDLKKRHSPIKRKKNIPMASSNTEFNNELTPKRHKTEGKEKNEKTAVERSVQVHADPDLLFPAPKIFHNHQQHVENDVQTLLNSLMITNHSVSKERFTNSANFNQSENVPNIPAIDGNQEHKKKSPQKGYNLNCLLQSSPEINKDVRTENNDVNFLRYSPSKQGSEKDRVESKTGKHVESKMDVYEVLEKNKYILHLHHPCSFKFYGRMCVTLFAGELEILGYCLANQSAATKVNIYSPRFYSNILVETKSPSNELDKIQLEMVHLSGKLVESDAKKLIRNVRPHDTVVLVEELSTNFIPVLNKYFDKSLFPQRPFTTSVMPEVSQGLQCMFDLKSSQSAKTFRKNPDWDEITLKKCTVICGGKGVGKSSLLKYLINRSFSKFQSVLCLDFDPGQPEFTAPGCISAVVITTPLLGPNFTHTLQPKRMVYLGDINVAQCPKLYLQCVEHIIDHCQQDPILSQLPCFVNTMGFCKGLGVALMISVLKMLKPNTLIQIKSVDHSRNYPFDLNCDCLKSEEGFSFPVREHVDISYDYYSVNSCADYNGISIQGALKPRELRDIMSLSYFSQMMSPSLHNFNAVQPHSLPFAKLYLGVNATISPKDILKAFNGNLIALCHFEDNPDADVIEAEDQTDFFKIVIKPGVIPCCGLAFVRGIDTQTKKFYVLTHLSEDELEPVNCLTIGSISPPESIYLKQDCVEGPVLYTSVNTGDNVQSVKRAYRVPMHNR